MVNDCYNTITITSDNKITMDNLYNKYFKKKLLKEGTLKDYEKGRIKLIDKGHSGLLIKLWSPNEPDYNLLNELLENYNIWLKNIWKEEGGDAGIYIGYKDTNNKKIIKEFRWYDLCIESANHHFRND